MTELSGMWAGVTIGDAAASGLGAPYSDVEYASIYSKILSSNSAPHGIIPNYGGTTGGGLRVRASTPVSMTVQVQTGAALIRGRFYETDDNVDLVLAAADATNPRIDRIVLRITFASQTIRAAVLTGTPAATPSRPALTDNSTTLEICLAHVWVAATATTIDNPEIHDERLFIPNYVALGNALGLENLVINSEFMAFSCLSTVPSAFGSTQPPDLWDKVGTVTAYASAAKPSWMARGRSVSVTAGAANAGLSQTFPINDGLLCSVVASVNVTAGDAAVLQIVDNLGTTITKNIRRTGSWITEQLVFTAAAGATSITVSLLCLNNTDVVLWGQVLVCEGYVTGPFRQIHEIIYFKHAIGDANWNTTAKSSGTTTLDTDTDFQTLILPGTKAVYTYAQINDSGSAAGTAALSLRSTSGTLGMFTVRASALANDTLRSESGWVPLDGNNQFSAVVTATGAGTLDAILRIHGIQT